MRIVLFLVGVVCLTASGCTVVSANRTFPKLAWYWSADAKMQRDEDAQEKLRVKEYKESQKTNSVAK